MEDLTRPLLTLHVFGSRGCGKTTLKKQWFDSSHCKVLSEIADVHIRIQHNCTMDVLKTITQTSSIVNNHHHTFLIMYHPDNRESIDYCQRCLEIIYETAGAAHPDVVVVENHFEPTFKPHSDEPTKFPISQEFREKLRRDVPGPVLWRVSLLDGVQLSCMFESVIRQPLLSQLNERTKVQLIEKACSEGHVQVLKLLVGTLPESNLVMWLPHTMISLERLDSNNIAKRTALTAVARFVFNLDPTMTMSTIVRYADKYSMASLYLINQFCNQTKDEKHFVMCGVALMTIPLRWIDNSKYTHINLTNNLLTFLPKELFQLSGLRNLNLSHNCLESIPSILSWNCPKLKELDLTYNRLADEKYFILEGRKSRENRLNQNPPNKEVQRDQINAAQRLLRLTGYNLYPCVCSLSKVSISHNINLTQVPEWVCVLPNLTLLEMLNLPHLTSLTPYLAHCRNLCILKIDPDNLVSPPSHEARRGTRVIMAYLRCRLRGSTPYKHVKVVLIGERGSGKCTIFNQIMGQSPRADGGGPHMEVATVEYPPRPKAMKDRPRVTLHVVNFAGDAIYQCTHKCFLTYRSVFVCVWDVTEGKEALQALTPWLRSIQACVPNSPVLLVATHIDQRPGLSPATIVQWEEELFGQINELPNSSYARQRGLPPIKQSVVMNCLRKEDTEMLLKDIYEVVLRMKHPRRLVSLIESVVPRSYQELQSLVEVKVRSLCRDKNRAPVLRHEEFIDYVRSLTLHDPNDLEHDEEEFMLACNFLHEAGAIVHFRSQVAGVSDLYFLEPQWLFNSLAAIVGQLAFGQYSTAIVTSEDLPLVFQKAKVPSSLYGSFLAMLESFDIIVSLDFEKKKLLIPSLLPTTPPDYYPGYDLSEEDNNLVSQYVDFEYIPPSLFPQLIARVLLYIRQLSGQLISLEGNDIMIASSSNRGGEKSDTGFLSTPSEAMSNGTSMIPPLKRSSSSYHVDSSGYIVRDDMDIQGDIAALRSKIWALSTTNLGGATPLLRHHSLTRKLVSISQPILQHQHHQHTPTSGHSSLEDTINEEIDFISVGELTYSDKFASYVFWNNGLYVEFPCGTKFWLELCASAIMLVIVGETIPRVKVLSFINSCLDGLVNECFTGLEMTYYSPCPCCLRTFWKERQDLKSSRFSFGLEASTSELTVNEFKGVVQYSRLPQTGEIGRSPSFSGTRYTISRSPSPLTDSKTSDETPVVAVLDGKLTLFPLAATIHQSVMSSTILCPKCSTRVSLQAISPHVLLVDFKDALLLTAKKLEFDEQPESKLGGGGFGKVFRGTYDRQPVAVKVFRKKYSKDVLLNRYKDLREELTIMSQLDHPRVVSLLGVCFRPLCMVLKLAPLGSLRDHLNLCPRGMKCNIAHRLLYQVADGLRYLHSLYIVHRDIKPSNVLIWSLHPDKGVDVKLADYGVSQFNAPGGLHRPRGTEEYMAPELFRHNSVAYDEKVDIFSFGLVLHYVVTGKKLFANIANKRDQLSRIYNSDIPQLSSALSETMNENKPLPTSVPFPDLLVNGIHPAAREDIVSSCHSVCMQRILEDCVRDDPTQRPSAEGVCSRLLVCPGEMLQNNFYTTEVVKLTGYSPETEVLVALEQGRQRVMLIPRKTWQMERKSTAYDGQNFSCLSVIGKEVFLASEESNLLFSLQLPGLSSGTISPQPLMGMPLCIFPQIDGNEVKVIVGMSGGRIAVFSKKQGRHLLQNKPFVTQVMTNPDAMKTAIRCGVYHRGTIWCGCGRYLIELDPKEYLMRSYKPITRESEAPVAKVVGNREQIWVSLDGQSSIVVYDTVRKNTIETLDCNSILGETGVMATQTIVTEIASSPDVVWVGTLGGHLMAFHPVTMDVLLVQRRQLSINSIMCLGRERLAVFGEGVIGERPNEERPGEEVDRDCICGMFTIWTSYLGSD